MSEFTVRSDSINVEQIMEQVRARIRDKRGVDYTEQQIRDLAAVKLEKFLDPRSVRSDLLEAYRQSQEASARPVPNYAFDEDTLFETHRGPLRFARRLLKPLLKLFFNPNRLIQALHIQSEVNTIHAQAEAARRGRDQLHFEVLHNLVLETTRMAIELKNLRMRVESMAGRLEFNERRARALESVVVYRPSSEERRSTPEEHRERPRPIDEPAPGNRGGYVAAGPPSAPPPSPSPAAASGAPSSSSPVAPSGVAAEGPGQRSRRRRRRRGRRGGGLASTVMGPSGAGQNAAGQPDQSSSDSNEGTPLGGSIQEAVSVDSHRAEPIEPPAPDSPPRDEQ